jgi:hypothetical protein
VIRASGALRERVASLLKTSKKARGGAERAVYAWVAPPGSVIVRESEREGEATVEMTLPAACECLDLWLPTGLFEILQKDKNADGAHLLIFEDGRIEAHVTECKKTIDQTTWLDATEQMRWTLVKLQALAGALGEHLAGAVLYTAYREDRLSEEESANPAQTERLVGVPQGEREIELTYTRRKQLEWTRGRVRLRGFHGDFPHHRIELDEEDGRGRMELRPSSP